MESYLKQPLTITRISDSVWCVNQTKKVAGSLGFNERQQWEIATAISELVTNAVKFAGSGRVEFHEIREPHYGLEIIVEDDGPGIGSIENVLADGFSEGHQVTGTDFDIHRRGLGSGLSAVSRLMDHIVVENKSTGGARVITKKWLKCK